MTNRSWLKEEVVEVEFDSPSESDCKYRYILKCKWTDDLPKITFVMLNPSVANASICDPTLSRCVSFAKSWGYGGINVVNLFAYISTDPANLKTISDPVGKLNDRYIVEAVEDSELIIYAWGTKYGKIQKRDSEVISLLLDSDPQCIKKTKNGDPAHPLYLSGNLIPIIF